MPGYHGLDARNILATCLQKFCRVKDVALWDMVAAGHGFLCSMLDDLLLREFFTILLFASGPFSDAFVFGLQCLDWVQIDGLRALNSFSENTRRVGRPVHTWVSMSQHFCRHNQLETGENVPRTNFFG